MSRYRGLNRPERGRRERPILPTYLAWNGRFHYDLRAGHGIVQPMTEEPEDRHPNDAEAERLHGRDAPALVQPADLCPPVGWWQGRGSSRTTPEGLTETTTFRVENGGGKLDHGSGGIVLLRAA